MKTLSTKAFEEIRRFVYQNARPLELALWQYHFENGSKEAVLDMLQFYQNSDGGYGNTIEPDNWNPASSPYIVQYVLRIFKQIDFLDTRHPIYQSIFRFLEDTEYKADYGWFFVIPSNQDYPHAIWWDYSEEANVSQSIGTTASLSGFILRYGDPQSKLYCRARDYSKRLIEKLPVTESFGDMGIKGYLTLLEDIKEAGLAEDFNLNAVSDIILDLVRKKMREEKNNFMATPLEFIYSTDSILYEEYRQEVEEELDHIIDSRSPSGVWDIPWEWYNGNRYPKEFAISENWWKSFEAIDKLLKLKRFGRLIR